MNQIFTCQKFVTFLVLIFTFFKLLKIFEQNFCMSKVSRIFSFDFTFFWISEDFLKTNFYKSKVCKIFSFEFYIFLTSWRFFEQFFYMSKVCYIFHFDFYFFWIPEVFWTYFWMSKVSNIFNFVFNFFLNSWRFFELNYKCQILLRFQILISNDFSIKFYMIF